MAERVAPKWRPPLSAIVFAVLLTVLALPAAVVIAFRAMDRTSSQFGPVEITALLVALAITLVIAAVFSRTITGPIDALIRTTREIARGGRAAISAQQQHGTREIAQLSQSFLDMAERLVDRTEYVHSFAAHVSHELKSPLTAIRGSAELLLDDTMPAADRRRFVEHILSDSDRLAAVLDRLRALARAEVPLDGGATTIAVMLPVLQRSHPKLTVVAEGATEAWIGLSEEAAGIVLGHLADNAVQHGATRLTLAVVADGDRVRITLSDDGTGIAPAHQDKVFEPFFTTRREQGGTGMGLGVAQAMLRAHGAEIQLLASARGATFLLVVPAASP